MSGYTQQSKHITTARHATEANGKLACASYQKRFRIEEIVKDFKNTGRSFGLELTGVRHVDRLALLLLALALVYRWLLLWGAYVIATGQQQLVDNVRKPTLSLFQKDCASSCACGRKGNC